MTEAEAVKLIDERMCFGRGKWSEHHMPEIDIYWQAGEMAIKALESRKTGYWVCKMARDPIGYNVKLYMCSVCNGWSSDMPYRFCPHCGAYMGGNSDD